MALTAGAFPPDPPRQEPQPPRVGGAGPAELVNALFTVAAATVGTFFVWRVLESVPPPWDIAPTHWQVGLLAWLLIGGLAVTTAILGYLGWQRLSPAEAAVYLQDWRCGTKRDASSGGSTAGVHGLCGGAERLPLSRLCGERGRG